MKQGIIYQQETYQLVGICMEVHRTLGRGLKEVIYKDALEFEFKNKSIPFAREKEYLISYKNIILPHKFYADFVVYDNILFEVKATSKILDEHIAQTLNYMKLAKSSLGLIVNFSNTSLAYKRLIL